MERINDINSLGAWHTEADDLALSYEYGFFHRFTGSPLDNPAANAYAFCIPTHVRYNIDVTFARFRSHDREQLREVLAELRGPWRGE